MKKIKSILAFSLILVLMFSFSVSAFAAKTKKPFKTDAETVTENTDAETVTDKTDAETVTDKTDADAEEVTEFNWEDFEDAPESLGLEGSFYTLNQVAIQFWVPDIFEQEELTDEDAEDGLIAYFDDGDGDFGFFVTYFDAEGMTLEEYADEVAEDKDYTDLEYLVVNGIDAIAYTENDEEMELVFKYVSILTDNGYILTYTYWDWADEDYQEAVVVMVASMQPEET